MVKPVECRIIKCCLVSRVEAFRFTHRITHYFLRIGADFGQRPKSKNPANLSIAVDVYFVRQKAS